MIATKRLGLTAVLVMVAIVALGASPVFGGDGRGGHAQLRAATAQGIVSLDGQDVVVEVLVAVNPGEDAHASAQAALHRAYPHAREIDSADFSLNGLLWDVYFDGDPGNDQVPVSYNGKGVPANLANLDHRSVWLASMATWTNVASSSFAFADAGDTGRCPSLVQECKGRQKFDGNNDVGWLDIKDPSVLGVTWFGTTVDEFDMVLDNKNFAWYIGAPVSIPGGSFDAQTVWTHEFGHGLGLGHSDVDGAVMEPYYEGIRRALSQDDIDGISSLYPAGTPNDAPVVLISSPADGSTFASGATIDFAGTASDTEDGDLTTSLIWTSSIDGAIGAGAAFSSVLSDGVHTIAAEATDSGGKTGSASITITVGTPPPTPALTVTVTTDKPSYVSREKALITAHVEDSAGPVGGAAVHIEVGTASGRLLACDPTTNGGGDATCTYKVNSRRDGVGTYTVEATASKSGSTPGSGGTTFEVTR